MSGTSSPPSGSSYVQRQLNFTITLGKGTFGQSGQNTVKLSNLRAKVDVLKGGFPAMDQAQIRIYGVQPAIMNQVSTLGIPLQMIRLGNTVTVEAGDTTNGFAVVYTGYMMRCWQDFSEAPETSLQIEAFGGMAAALYPVPPITFPGSADVATIMSGLANTMGMRFENNGVQVKISSPYFAGTAMEQAHALARAANIEMYPDFSQPAGNSSSQTPVAGGTLAIWPKLGTRTKAIPLISAASGLVGYPQFESNGMTFTTLYNPNIFLGGQIQMQSSVGAAATTAPSDAPVPAGTQTGGPNGLWYVVAPLAHDLSSQLPGGPWFTSVHCQRIPGSPGSSS
jgi:hypothetical protein